MKVSKMIPGFSTLMFTGMLLFSCRHEYMYADNTPITGGNQPCSADTVYFQNQVLPLIISNCAQSGCHDAASHQEGVQLTSYSSIMNSADVRPGNPNGSDLYRYINTSDPGDVMPPPPASPFTAAQKQLIYTWIEQGARNNACQDCDSSQYTFATSIQPLLQAQCRGCHNPTTNSGGLDMSTHAQIQSIALNGKLMGTINHSPGYPAMPPGVPKLSDCRINQVQNWVDDGAPNN